MTVAQNPNTWVNRKLLIPRAIGLIHCANKYKIRATAKLEGLSFVITHTIKTIEKNLLRITAYQALTLRVEKK